MRVPINDKPYINSMRSQSASSPPQSPIIHALGSENSPAPASKADLPPSALILDELPLRNTSPARTSTKQLELLDAARAQNSDQLYSELNSLRDPQTFSFSPRAYEMSPIARSFLPSDESLLTPRGVLELKELLLDSIPPRSKKKVGPDKKTEISNKTKSIRDNRNNIKQFKDGCKDTYAKINARYRNKKIDQEAAWGRATKIKETMIGRIDDAIDALITTVRDSISKYPRCEERNTCVSECCSYMNELLDLRIFAHEMPLPGRHRFDERIEAALGDFKSEKIKIDEKASRFIDAFEDSGAEQWAVVKAAYDLLVFRRVFAEKLKPEERLSSPDAIVGMLSDITNLGEAARLANGRNHGWSATEFFSAAQISREVAINTFAEAQEKKALKAVPQESGWASRFVFEWRVLREVEVAQSRAMTQILVNKVRSEKKLTIDEKQMLLEPKYWSKERALEIGETLGRLEEDLALKQNDLKENCSAVSAADDVRRFDLDMSDFVYSRLVARAIAEGMKAYAEHLDSVPEPNMAQEDLAEEAATESMEKLVSHAEAPSAPASQNLVVEEMRAAADQAQKQQTEDASGPLEGKATGQKSSRTKTFGELRGLFLDANKCFADGENALKALRYVDPVEKNGEDAPMEGGVSVVVDGVERNLKFKDALAYGQKKYEVALESFAKLSEEMNKKRLDSIYNMDQEGLAEMSSVCTSQVAFCKNFVKLNTLLTRATECFANGENMRQWQPRMDTFSAEIGSITHAQQSYEDSLQNARTLSEAMKKYGVSAVYEVDLPTLEKRMLGCEDRIEVCKRFLRSSSGKEHTQEILKKWTRTPGFQVMLMYKKDALEKKGLIELKVLAPVVKWKGLSIQRRVLWTHEHLAPSTFRDVLALPREELAKRIEKAHTKSDAERGSSLPTAERLNIADKLFAADLVIMGAESLKQGDLSTAAEKALKGKATLVA